MSDLYRRNRYYYNPERANRWQDWAILFVSIWFFFSPWILQFGHAVPTADVGGAAPSVHRAAWDAWIAGAVVFLVALSAIGRFEVWQERLNTLIGFWVFIAPWILGFAGAPLAPAAWDHWVCGAIICLCALANYVNLRDQQRPVPGE